MLNIQESLPYRRIVDSHHPWGSLLREGKDWLGKKHSLDRTWQWPGNQEDSILVFRAFSRLNLGSWYHITHFWGDGELIPIFKNYIWQRATDWGGRGNDRKRNTTCSNAWLCNHSLLANNSPSEEGFTLNSQLSSGIQIETDTEIHW